MAKKAPKTKAPAKKAKKPSKKKESSKAKKSSGADAPAHPNEWQIDPSRYNRCPSERRNLDTSRTPFAGKPKPPRALCGHEFKGVKLSKDGWAPGENKPRKCKLTYKELAERWAAERSKAELDQYKKDCVWAKWCPGMRAPKWWRLDLDDDAAYRVLCFCWAKNIRCYQPVLGLDFKEFCTKALGDDPVAKGLIAIDKSCREISEEVWREENEKPEKCDDSVYVGFFP